MELGLMDLLALWGAVTGTLGTVVGIYALRLNKRLSTPRLAIPRASGSIAEEFESGVELKLTCSLASESNVSATVRAFEIDLGRRLNRDCTTWARYDGAARPRLTHCTTAGKPSQPLGPSGSPGDFDKPIIVPPNGLIPAVHLHARVHAKEGTSARTATQLKTRLRARRYVLVALLADGSEVRLRGTKVGA